jgi:preprotein translocase subunit SecF
MLSLGLMGHGVGTLVGEETISSFSSTICFCWIEGVVSTMVVAVVCAYFKKNVKRMNFVV